MLRRTLVLDLAIAGGTRAPGLHRAKRPSTNLNQVWELHLAIYGGMAFTCRGSEPEIPSMPTWRISVPVKQALNKHNKPTTRLIVNIDKERVKVSSMAL